MEPTLNSSESSAGLKSAIKTEANRLGFTLFGVTEPESPGTLPNFLSWLAQGRNGSMDYLVSERAVARRADPHLILPDVRSVIVLGLRYPRPADLPESTAPNLRGRVAAYAWGKDYHDLIPPRLEQLAQFIQSRIDHPLAYKAYTDTGPILERDLASRAGLGWMGKNTCLIDPRSGSYYLLAELLINIKLENDLTFTADHCGSCRRCIDACPTACILPDRTLDARRCISYLTIENKGSIPTELRPQLGDWVFGCDICQQVCPWNIRFAAPEFDSGLSPQTENARPDLIAALGLTPQDFNRLFKGSPILRARRRGYLRNVAVVLGNFRDARAVPVLANTLQSDSEPLVRAHAAWALGQIGGKAARQVLEMCSASETDDEVLAEMTAAMITCLSEDSSG